MGRLLRRCVAVAFAALMVFCGAARAAFPGRDGLLIVQPASGAGVVLVAPNGTDAHRICTTAGSCGSGSILTGPVPTNAEVSPDGQSLIYPDSGTGFITGVSGLCVAACTGADAGGLNLSARVVAFDSDGDEVSYASHTTVVTVGPDGLRDSSVTLPKAAGTAPITSLAWSVTGTLGVVSGGRVWIEAAGRWRSLGTGSTLSFSPTGRSVTVTRHAVIWMVSVLSGRARRLVPGEAPVISPDGREVAFLGPGRRLEIVGVAGGHPRQVGTVRGVALDWQAIPAKPVSDCRLVPGATVVVDDGLAVVSRRTRTISSSLGGGTSTALLGCARSDGETHLLTSYAENTFDDTGYADFGTPKLAGLYMAVGTSEANYKENFGGAGVDEYDLRSGQEDPFGGGGALSAECMPDVTPGTVCGTTGPLLTPAGTVATETIQPIPTCLPVGGASCPTVEAVNTVGPAGVQTLDQVSIPPGAQTPYINGLGLSGTTLTWDDTGTIHTATLR